MRVINKHGRVGGTAHLLEPTENDEVLGLTVHLSIDTYKLTM